ncbi:MAG: nucleotide exchange factor GrpE [Thermoanaerobaculia bacterium]
MTDEPKGPAPDDEVYVIDDTGEMQDVRELAGYRDGPEPVNDNGSPAGNSLPVAEEAAEAGGSELGSLRAENEKLRDQFLRSRADFENFRRRMEKEKVEFRRYAVADTLRDLLPVLDNFERALSVPTASVEDFRTGIEMIARQLAEILERTGLQTIDPAGEPFDPLFHEAIARVETAEAEPNSVFDVMQKGYMLHERLLRPAMVRVAVPSGRGEGEDGSDPS